MEIILEAISELTDLETTLKEQKKKEATHLEKILQAQTELLERMTTLNEKKSPTKTSDKVRLPKIEIPSFNGEITEFQPFWDSFATLIDKSDISNIEKFTYLKSKLTGKAS